MQVLPEAAAAIDAFLERLEACASGASEFTLELDDPAGVCAHYRCPSPVQTWVLAGQACLTSLQAIAMWRAQMAMCRLTPC